MPTKQYTFILKKTADGSDTLYSPEMEESYHSVNGAVQESRHVFIEAGLHHIEQKTIRIFEVGFGTGLNALLTWGEAHKKNLQISYDSIEAYPVERTITDNLNYNGLEPDLPSDAFQQIHNTSWNFPQTLENGRFRLHKISKDFTGYQFTDHYDLVYFDAFAPDKQPEMWDESIFSKIYNSLNKGGILVTYCAKGEVRRRMQRSGFKVERIPGPPGKREMLRAVKLFPNQEKD